MFRKELRQWGMYDKYCIEMNIKRDIPPIKGKSPVYMFGQDYFQDAFSWTEVMTITDEFMMMEGTPKGIEKIVHIVLMDIKEVHIQKKYIMRKKCFVLWNGS